MSVGDVNSKAVGSGARFNDGKPDYGLIPLMALEDCARVFGYGKRKYASWNWAKGMAWSIPLACLLRHLSAWQRGEDNDPESGLPHLGHAMCNLVMLAAYARTYKAGDDRPIEWLGLAAGKESTGSRDATAYPDGVIPHAKAAELLRSRVVQVEAGCGVVFVDPETPRTAGELLAERQHAQAEGSDDEPCSSGVCLQQTEV